MLLRPELAPPGVALALDPVSMGSRVEMIEELENAGGVIHIFLALIHALGWTLGELEDVRNEKEGPARLERAYSLLERWPDEVGRAERHQALENILYANGEETDDDDEEDEDEDDADDEQEGDNFKKAPAQALVADRSPQAEEEAAAAEAGVGLEPAAAKAGVALEPAVVEAGADSEPASGSQDSVLDYERNSGDDTEWDDSDLLNCGEETDTPGDEWAGEEDEQEETDKEESGELSATDADTQATLEADASDQEGAGSSGGRAYSARRGGEASGAAVGHKRGADAAYYTPLLPKRPRHETSTSSTISTASTVNQEVAVAEEASMMLVEPPQDGLNNAGGNALVVYLGAPAPMAATAMVPIAAGGSTAEATGEGSPLIALQRQVSDLQQWQLQTMLDRRMEQQQMTQIQRALRTLWYPEELVAECNKAVVAIGATNVRHGTGSFLAQGLIATAHHVLLDCGWNAATPSLVQVGMGENIVWSHQAEVLAWAPTPRPPATGMPDHHFNKPKPWLDLALLKIVRSPSSIAGLGACLRASRFPIKQGVPIAVLGYGQQTSSDAQTVMFGEVACCARRDDRIGCAVFDIGGAGMLSGHSGGPVIDRRDGGVHGYCISSQSEASLGSCGITINTPFGRRTIKGKAKIQNAVGGLHTVIPISELAFLLGTSLTA